MDKVEVRAVIKYFCKKGMSPGMSPYSAVKNWAAELRRRKMSNVSATMGPQNIDQ